MVFDTVNIYHLETSLLTCSPLLIAGQPGWAGCTDQKRAGWSSSDGRPDCQGESLSVGNQIVICFVMLQVWCHLCKYQSGRFPPTAKKTEVQSVHVYTYFFLHFEAFCFFLLSLQKLLESLLWSKICDYKSSSFLSRLESSPNSCLKRWRPCTLRSSNPQWISLWPIWRVCQSPREGSSKSRRWNGDITPPLLTWAKRMRTRCLSLMWFCPSLWRYSYVQCLWKWFSSLNVFLSIAFRNGIIVHMIWLFILFSKK